MNRQDRLPTDFDLTVGDALGAPGEEYMFPRTRNPAEAVRRQALPEGTTMCEFQGGGVYVLRKIVEAVADTAEDSGSIDEFTSLVVALACLNTAKYIYADRAQRVEADGMRPGKLITLAGDPIYEQQRRRLKYPRAYEYQNGIQLLRQTAGHFAVTEALANDLTAAHANGDRNRPKRAMAAGRDIGEAALALALAAQVGAAPMPDSPYTAQHLARTQGLHLVRSRPQINRAVAQIPSSAAFADGHSRPTDYIRRNASDRVVEAMEIAQSHLAEASAAA